MGVVFRLDGGFGNRRPLRVAQGRPHGQPRSGPPVPIAAGCKCGGSHGAHGSPPARGCTLPARPAAAASRRNGRSSAAPAPPGTAAGWTARTPSSRSRSSPDTGSAPDLFRLTSVSICLSRPGSATIRRSCALFICSLEPFMDSLGQDRPSASFHPPAFLRRIAAGKLSARFTRTRNILVGRPRYHSAELSRIRARRSRRCASRPRRIDCPTKSR